MDRHHPFPENPRIDHRAGIEGRVFEGLDERRRIPCIGTSRPGQSPFGARQRHRRQHRQLLASAATIEPQSQSQRVAVSRSDIIKHHGATRMFGARPLPAGKSGFKRGGPGIPIEVSGTAPAQCRLYERDLDLRRCGERTPPVPPLAIESERRPRKRVGIETQPALHPSGSRDRDLVEFDCERITVPRDRACADRQVRLRSVYRIAAALGQSPAPGPTAVERNIQSTVIERICRPTASSPGVIRRKHAADKGDQGDAVPPVVAQGIDIPPRVAVRRDGCVETMSETRLAATKRPDNAAIGTPGPGCTLPPAK